MHPPSSHDRLDLAAAPIPGSAPAEPRPAQLRLPAPQREQLSHLIEISYPFEACGLLVGRAAAGSGQAATVEQVVLARNLNVDRSRDRYLLDPADFLAADRVARAAGLEIVGIWHSHPDAAPRPSQTDLEAAWEGYSYLIAEVTALGICRFRSWRLVDGRFVEEDLSQ